MSGIGEILAIAELAVQVVGAVEKVINLFEKAQNAPSELGQLRVSVLRLSRHFDMLRAEHESTGLLLIAQEDSLEIEGTLRGCKALFDGYDDARSRGSVLQAMWGTQQSGRLEGYQKLIDRHFWQILLPLWLQTLNTMQARSRQDQPRPVATTATTIVPAETTPKGATQRRSLVPVEHLSSLKQGIDQLKEAADAGNRAQSETTLQNLDESLRKCWADLGLPVPERTYDVSGHEALRRMSTITYEVAPATLKLENVLDKHRRIELHRVHIMARDKDSRILLYQNADNTIQVTQIIQFGCIPWTPSTTSKRVSFLRPHVVTVKDHAGHHIYHIDPKYRFSDLDAAHRFQETLRERTHLRAFDFVELAQNGTVISRRQVLRFWRRTTDNKDGTTTVLTTMTFLATSLPNSDGCTHKELDLADYDSEASFASTSASMLSVVTAGATSSRNRAKPSQTVLIRASLASSKGNLTVKFESVEAAEEFKEFLAITQRRDGTSVPMVRPAAMLPPTPPPSNYSSSLASAQWVSPEVLDTRRETRAPSLNEVEMKFGESFGELVWRCVSMPELDGERAAGTGGI